MITKILIRNYRLFRSFDLDLRDGINTLIGANATGKSTLLEAINLALTGRLHGRPLATVLSPYLLNAEATREYVGSLQPGATRLVPPPLIIELFLAPAPETEPLRGTNNLIREDACGLRLQARYSSEFDPEYREFAANVESVKLVPTEYYRVERLDFSGNGITSRSVPESVSLIDPSTLQWQSGVDVHMQQILGANLAPRERVELSRQYRSLRQEFADRPAVKLINDRLKASDSGLTDRTISIAMDISSRYTWESSLAAHIDDLPLQMGGKGEQSALKTLLAIGQKADEARVVLIEEPEAHLAFAALRKLVSRIEERCAGKQVIIATHSAYVLNKLGLENFVLLGSNGAMRLTDLPADTVGYFKKLPGFDTLRLVLAEEAILVEGPSDELILQRAYLNAYGKFPIEDGIDVISVGLSHKRFLDVAVRLKKRVRIVTDNDGKTTKEVMARFEEYLKNEFVTLHTGSDPTLKTLEPQLANVNNLADMNAVLGGAYESKEALIAGMTADKTTAALAIFESPRSIVMPEYITDAIRR